MTTALIPELRSRLGAVIQDARRVAELGARRVLESLAVDRAKPFDTMSIKEQVLRNALRNRGRQAGDRRDRVTDMQPLARLAHEVAYEHWHRMLFARFLAENELLITPEYGVEVSLEDCRELARELGRDPWELAGAWAQEMLPEIFADGDPIFELALPPETRQKLEELLELLPPAVFTARDSLGWTYQYWRSDEKDRVNRSGRKVGADQLPAVTQLFTERYMVHFLLHNTIGAWRAGKVLAADPSLALSAPNEETLRRRIRLDTGGGYDFAFLRFIRDKAERDVDEERSGPWRPVAGVFPQWPGAARDLRVLDPCCGSGHFLVEAFELLVRLRMEEGLSARTAACAVLEDNLFGLELDPRCTQIAAFNLALAAWRLAGEWIHLPPLNVACCGIAPHASEAEWVRLADELEGLTEMAEDLDLFGGDASRVRGPLQEGMAGLHRLFRRARELGSLIDPEAAGDDLFRAGYDDLKKLLDAAVKGERRTRSRNERAVAAAGMAEAAEILMGRYTLVVTNVPFLARGKQGERLRAFAEDQHSDAKGDIATVFVSRIFRWLGDHGTQAVVTPQNWLFLTTYRKLRERLLKEKTWNVVARLGIKAFDTPMWDFNVALLILSAERPSPDSQMAGLDVSSPWGQRPIKAAEKAVLLSGGADVIESIQAEQVGNPDARVVIGGIPPGSRWLFEVCAYSRGICTGDDLCFVRCFWEYDVPVTQISGRFWQHSTSDATRHYSGQHRVIRWNAGDLSIEEFVEARLGHDNTGMWIRGRVCWGNTGILVSPTGQIQATLYQGHYYDANSLGLVTTPADEDSLDYLPAVWAFCSDPGYHFAVREVDSALKVGDALVKVPFDLDHWTKVAAERYPNGLPEPYSDDPTQWIFHGDPCRSVVWDEKAKVTTHGSVRFDHTVLQVAVGCLLGYP